MTRKHTDSRVGFLKEKKLIIVSDGKIITKKTSPITSLFKFVVVGYLAYNNILYFKIRDILDLKNNQISNLNTINANLEKNLNTTNKALEDVKYYFNVLNEYDRFNAINTKSLSTKQFLEKSDVENEKYVALSPLLDRTNNELNNIDNIIDNRIENLENFVNKVGIGQKDLENIYRVNYKEKQSTNTEKTLIEKNSVIKKDSTDFFKKKVDYMIYLENFINKLPLSEPITNYRYTSKFGFRNHPFDHETKFHRGVDMAGPINITVRSPSDGKVLFAGVKYGYGNYIKIDHGNNITTEYGHLKKFLVKSGDVIKRGQGIGIQGNTGRSTGPHLHYEVKFNKKPLDPKYFIENGNRMF